MFIAELRASNLVFKQFGYAHWIVMHDAHSLPDVEIVNT